MTRGRFPLKMSTCIPNPLLVVRTAAGRLFVAVSGVLAWRATAWTHGSLREVVGVGWSSMPSFTSRQYLMPPTASPMPPLLHRRGEGVAGDSSRADELPPSMISSSSSSSIGKALCSSKLLASLGGSTMHAPENEPVFTSSAASSSVAVGVVAFPASLLPTAAPERAPVQGPLAPPQWNDSRTCLEMDYRLLRWSCAGCVYDLGAEGTRLNGERRVRGTRCLSLVVLNC